MNKLILSDVCDTLINLNSTYSYIKYLYENNYGNKFIGYLINNHLFCILTYIIYKLTKYDIHRKITFLFFKELKKSNLNNININFWNYYISKKTNILAEIIKYKNKGNKVILVSASINPPIDMLGRHLGIDYFSSELEEENGKYTGRVKKDFLGNKEELLISKKINILKYDDVTFYTDNISDIGFICKIQELAKNSKFFLILKNEKTRTKRLKILSSNNIKNYEFIF